MSNCPEYDRIALEADQSLKDLMQATALMHELLRAKQFEKFGRLDRELELLLGKKERALGALGQHLREHRCQSVPSEPGVSKERGSQ